HRGGIGVVAFVDDGRLTVGRGQKEALAPALLRREAAKRRRAGGKIGAERLRRNERAERVLRHMRAGRAKLEHESAATHARVHARAAAGRLDLKELTVAIGSTAKAQDSRAP